MSGIAAKVSSAIPSHLKSQLGGGSSATSNGSIDGEQRRHNKSQSHVVSD